MMTSAKMFSVLTVLMMTASIAAENCIDLLDNSGGSLVSGEYMVTHQGQSLTIYCLFVDGGAYTFFHPTTTGPLDISAFHDDTSHVLIRHLRSGNQYEAEIGQLPAFAHIPVSVQYNANVDYQNIINTQMGPYIYAGFIPDDLASTNTQQGWNVEGTDFTFTNCDANGNSYFATLFNAAGASYTSKVHAPTSIMTSWRDEARLVNDDIANQYFTAEFEIHHGGCGGYYPFTTTFDVTGVAIGVKSVQCPVPVDANCATTVMSGSSVGSIVTYACDRGFVVTSGDLVHTCTSDGTWAGTLPVCSPMTELPPIMDAGELTDPYDLACDPVEGACQPPGPFSVPTVCYEGFCSYVTYNAFPLRYRGDLKLRAQCTLPTALRVIAPEQLRLRVYFFTGEINDVWQYSLVQQSDYFYTNERFPLFGFRDFVFRFWVQYEGSVTQWWPSFTFTQPPFALCLFHIEN